MTHYRGQKHPSAHLRGKGISEEEFQYRLAIIMGSVRGPSGEWVPALADASVLEAISKNELIHPKKGQTISKS